MMTCGGKVVRCSGKVLGGFVVLIGMKVIEGGRMVNW